jgi:dolichol-phosphate mannosyltransferase
MAKVLIFTATYNESENITDFLNKVFSLQENLDILIVDDNSPDRTGELIENFKKSENKNLYLIKRPKKEGLNTAHKLAFEYAKKNEYEILITLDADLSHDPLIIPKFLKELKTNPFVIGSRYMRGGKNEMSFFRNIMSLFGNKLIKFLLNIQVDEFTTSYRGFNLKLLKGFNMSEVSLEGYSFFMGTINLLQITGNKIAQIPIEFKDRTKGKSKIPKIEILRTLKNLFLIKIGMIKK